jgi:hypothetical protein
MKPGDLRRFKDGLRGSGRTVRVSGQPFVVINIHPHTRPRWRRDARTSSSEVGSKPDGV